MRQPVVIARCSMEKLNGSSMADVVHAAKVWLVEAPLQGGVFTSRICTAHNRTK